MSKERLEKIKNNKTYLGGINTDDYDWLIKQAERVQELENILEQDHRQEVLEGLYEQNKRYREAMQDAGSELFIRIALDDEPAVRSALEILNKALEESE